MGKLMIVAVVLGTSLVLAAGEPAPAAPKEDMKLDAALQAAQNNEKAIKEVEAAHTEVLKKFKERLKATQEQVGKQMNSRLQLDDKTILSVAGAVVCEIEGEDDKRALVVRVDGKEISRVPLPNLDLKPGDLPPLTFTNVDNTSVRSESRSVNGVSNTKVWVDGKCVYDGPGGNSSSSVHSDNGKKYVEVKVDDQVIYKAGENNDDSLVQQRARKNAMNVGDAKADDARDAKRAPAKRANGVGDATAE
ncbi:MAG TPA: hypothetical protein VGP72_15950 [Planctomycetota bacterium]|jgi:hypothetical protein